MPTKLCEKHEPFDLRWWFWSGENGRPQVDEIVLPLVHKFSGMCEPAAYLLAGDPFSICNDDTLDLFFAVVRMCGDSLFFVAARNAERQSVYMRDKKTRGRVANATLAITSHEFSKGLLGERWREFFEKWTKLNDETIPWPPMNYCAGLDIRGRDHEELIPHLLSTPSDLRWLLLRNTANPARWAELANAFTYAATSPAASGGEDTFDGEIHELDTVETYEKKIDWAFVDSMQNSNAVKLTTRQAIESGVPLYFSTQLGTHDINRWPNESKFRQLPVVDSRYISIMQRIAAKVGITNDDSFIGVSTKDELSLNGEQMDGERLGPDAGPPAGDAPPQQAF